MDFLEGDVESKAAGMAATTVFELRRVQHERKKKNVRLTDNLYLAGWRWACKREVSLRNKRIHTSAYVCAVVTT